MIILCQLLLFHYFYRTISNQYAGQQQFLEHSLESIYCTHGLLGGIQELAVQSEVELVLVDPDLVEPREQDSSQWANGELRSQEFSFSKRSQESTHKSILHLAAINETSGGQPNLKLFYESLKNNGYVTLQYDTSRPMQPEVYRRSSHLFEGAHELHDDHGSGEKVNKIYTEFIAHIFVLNRTHSLPESDQAGYKCKRRHHGSWDSRSTVIHIFVLYNYEYNPQTYWIQPALLMDELNKHKLLTYNVHWVDFRIPIEHHYLHPKRSVASISIANENRIHRRSIDSVRVFELKTERVLNYVNNSFIYCTNSPFNISGLIESQKRYGKYSMLLDDSRPEPEGELKAQLQYQIDLAIQFMNTFSEVYGKFSHWLTGSSLLSYLKFCDLTTILGGENLIDDQVRRPIISLEFGVLAKEFNDTVLEGLANAANIGIKMISDWRKPNRVIHFKLADCPNIVFLIYPYELRKDFYEYFYITLNSMVLNQKRTRKRSTKMVAPSLIDDGGASSWGHHVFGLHNLELCWTQIEGISKLFRVPCNVHDHLRRIYVI